WGCIDNRDLLNCSFGDLGHYHSISDEVSFPKVESPSTTQSSHNVFFALRIVAGVRPKRPHRDLWSASLCSQASHFSDSVELVRHRSAIAQKQAKRESV